MKIQNHLKMKVLVIGVLALVLDPCCGRAVEESVVSVYNGPAQPGVYTQIANNIAEKITSPFYRFLGINHTEEKTTKRPFEHIELQDSNSTSQERDVEELSVEALKKTEKKPEKITLFSSYLPALSFQSQSQSDSGKFQSGKSETGKIQSGNFETVKETNDTITNKIDGDDDDLDDGFSLDDVDSVDSTPRGPFVYFLELVGSFIQLLWGGFLAIFNPSSSNSRSLFKS